MVCRFPGCFDLSPGLVHPREGGWIFIYQVPEVVSFGILEAFGDGLYVVDDLPGVPDEVLVFEQGLRAGVGGPAHPRADDTTNGDGQADLTAKRCRSCFEQSHSTPTHCAGPALGACAGDISTRRTVYGPIATAAGTSGAAALLSAQILKT